MSVRFSPADLTAAFVTLVFAVLCTLFVWQPVLATFADDSVSYLIMAQVFSPFASASAAVTAAFPHEAFYPPLFPALLAVTGAAHNIPWAHGVTALLLAASLPFIYRLGVRWLADSRAAALVLVCIVLLPSLWINIRGILSEPLFMLLLAALFCVLHAEGRNSGWKAGLLMAALVLTRAAALPMVGVYVLWAMASRNATWETRLRSAAPALAALIAYGVWVLLRPAATVDDYARILVDRSQGFSASTGGFLFALAHSVARQAHALVEGWDGSLLIYWIEGQPLRLLLASLLGLLALAGLAIRMLRGLPDAWMIAAYLATLLVWPFYEQLERFLFPVMPVLVLYVFIAAAEMTSLKWRSAWPGLGLIAALLLALTLPAMAFVHQRANVDGPATWITDWYRTPDINRARSRVRTQLDLFYDMRAIASLTGPNDKVMWYIPSYIALLADRYGMPTPDPGLSPADYLKAVRGSGADYVFLSRFHPRNTISQAAWRAGVANLSGHLKLVYAGTHKGDRAVTSLLFKVNKTKANNPAAGDGTGKQGAKLNHG